MIEILRKCPFCGTEDVFLVKELAIDLEYAYQVQCGDCGCCLPWEPAKDLAVSRWNTREGC